MGNRASGPRSPNATRKSVHWKSAGRPAAPGRPEAIGGADEPDAVTLRWRPAAHDGGAPLLGYQVECNRLGSEVWVRTSPPLVLRPELVLSGVEPPHRYQFRVAAVTAAGTSEYSPLSEVVSLSGQRSLRPPVFTAHITDVTALENDTTEFKVTFDAAPVPTVAWFKDGYEIFSSRRTAITTDETSSVLVFHQTLSTDEGEIKCTATNRAGHAVTRARLHIEAAPRLRYPRQYEDGLLYEINETIYLKTSVVGKPTPTVEWLHNGVAVSRGGRVEISNTGTTSTLKIQAARREDRGEYTVRANNYIGEDVASFLVTVTAPPEPPRRVAVSRGVDRTVTVSWSPPPDDGGCRVSNYVVEYYRQGWDVWLKAGTARTCSLTLYDLIEGSRYMFRVKADSPYGMSSPSEASAAVAVPGRPTQPQCLDAEAAVIAYALRTEDGQEPDSGSVRQEPAPPRRLSASDVTDQHMLVLCPDTSTDKTDKRRSLQLDLEDALCPPAMSLSAPDISTRCVRPFNGLRNAVSSTELLHERAMDRFFRVLAIRDQRDQKQSQVVSTVPQATDRTAEPPSVPLTDDILHRTPPLTNTIQNHTSDRDEKHKNELPKTQETREPSEPMERPPSAADDRHRWQSISFDEDYTASTVTSDEDVSEESGDDRAEDSEEADTYHPPPAPLTTAPTVLPKPILKKRDPDPLVKTPRSPSPQKKQDKITIFKRITKLPTQKTFPFPKLLNKKTHENKFDLTPTPEVEVTPPVAASKPAENKIDYCISDEGRTVIDHYSNIVKEFGAQKRTTPALYLDTEQLKIAAEQQQHKTQTTAKKPNKKQPVKKNTNNKTVTQNKFSNCTTKPVRPQPPKETTIKETTVKDASESVSREVEKPTQQIVLRTAERATVVIPIDYSQLEQRAQANVRSAIDYAVDVCLLGVAFWLYLFKDERLAIPPLALIIYRQLQEALQAGLPVWMKPHTPRWLQRRAP